MTCLKLDNFLGSEFSLLWKMILFIAVEIKVTPIFRNTPFIKQNKVYLIKKILNSSLHADLHSYFKENWFSKVFDQNNNENKSFLYSQEIEKINNKLLMSSVQIGMPLGLFQISI